MSLRESIRVSAERVLSRVDRQALAASVISGMAIATCTAGNVHARNSVDTGLLPDCAPYYNVFKYPPKDRYYEICHAYEINDVKIALRGYEKWGGSTLKIESPVLGPLLREFYDLTGVQVGSAAGFSKHHFETRYWNGPRAEVEQEVQALPQTNNLFGNHVDENVHTTDIVPQVSINRAFIKTEESSDILSPEGKLLKRRPLRTLWHTLCRVKLPNSEEVPVHFLHLWAVVANGKKNINCKLFAKNHGLQP